MVSKDYIGIIYALGAAILWGLVYNFDQKILTKTSPLAILFLGSLITAVITLPFAILNWESIKPALFSENRQFLYFFIATQILVILAEFFIFSSIQNVGASIASFFEIAYPLFVAIFAFIIFDGKLNMYFWIGAVLMFFGGVIITKYS
jgi:drug/metabolite transporter (DMT)-like permease